MTEQVGSLPFCPYCERPYSDKRGCEYLDDDERPVRYGDEVHPFSVGPTCRDCATPQGKEHHVGCACTECPSCHNQWHPGTSCAEDAAFYASLRPGEAA